MARRHTRRKRKTVKRRRGGNNNLVPLQIKAVNNNNITKKNNGKQAVQQSRRPPLHKAKKIVGSRSNIVTSRTTPVIKGRPTINPAAPLPQQTATELTKINLSKSQKVKSLFNEDPEIRSPNSRLGSIASIPGLPNSRRTSTASLPGLPTNSARSSMVSISGPRRSIISPELQEEIWGTNNALNNRSGTV